MVLHLLVIEGGNGKRKMENRKLSTPSASLVPLPQGDNGGEE